MLPRDRHSERSEESIVYRCEYTNVLIIRIGISIISTHSYIGIETIRISE